MYLELKQLNKSFGEKAVVKNLSLSLNKGELLCLLGSSGCGKTTTLKMIGGFLKPDSGEIWVDGMDITNLEPEQRPVSTVFQSYALFPHLTVLENVIYGLKFQNIKKSEARERGMEYLKSVNMEEYWNSRIHEISGGQQQRVALVRSLITNPKVLLLDEPLSNLDAKLRVKMREEIKVIQKKFDTTMVFVTHDQEEAMVLGDYIAIMDEGNLVQVGRPEEVYTKPATMFARNFLGISNTFENNDGEIMHCRPEELEFVPFGQIQGKKGNSGQAQGEISGLGQGEAADDRMAQGKIGSGELVQGEIVNSEFLGFYRQYYIRTDKNEEILVRTGRDVIKNIGERVSLERKLKF